MVVCIFYFSTLYIMETESMYPMSKEKATEILKRDNLDEVTKKYLMHVLNDTVENHYIGRIQYFQWLNDFVTEGYYKGDKYSELIKLNIENCGNENLLARANTICGLRLLFWVITQEQLLEQKYNDMIMKFIHHPWNAFKWSKWEYLTTKDEVEYMKNMMNTISNALQEKASTKKVSQ